MKVLIDMNLSPRWVQSLEQLGVHAVHWSAVGDARASDRTIMRWAFANRHVVFTHDLDFGALLAATQAIGPSVVQVRTQDVRPEHLAPVVASVFTTYGTAIDEGALVVMDDSRLRVRVLPLM